MSKQPSGEPPEFHGWVKLKEKIPEPVTWGRELEHKLIEARLKNTELHEQIINDMLAAMKEEDARSKHPGLQKLWEQYQTMLKLVIEK